MSQHTPGPWRIKDTQCGSWRVKTSKRYLADVYGPQAEANASLIAKAPEMLEELLSDLADCDECFDGGEIDCKPRHMRIRALLKEIDG